MPSALQLLATVQARVFGQTPPDPMALTQGGTYDQYTQVCALVMIHHLIVGPEDT